MQQRMMFVVAILGLVIIGAGCAGQDSVAKQLGFRVDETSSTGDWTVTQTGGSYFGQYASDDVMTYHASTPSENGNGRTAMWSDYVGYREAADNTFELTVDGENWVGIDTRYLNVLGEVSLGRGEALLIGPATCDPSPECYDGPGFLAIVNTPNGAIPGGVFRSGETTERGAFEEALRLVKIQ